MGVIAEHTHLPGGRFFKWLLGSFGAFAFTFFILSFTDLPFYAYHYLGTCNSVIHKVPKNIVLLGGSGMPSPDGLMRCYYTAEAAKKYKDAGVIIALPLNENDSLWQLRMMKRELVLRGVDSTRISYEYRGFNTHSQADNIAGTINDANAPLLIVTSPEHMYRSIKTFQKAGLAIVCGLPTFERPVDPESVSDTAGGEDARVKSLNLRYNIWSYMHYELLVLKEYCAISYYWMKGWI